MGSLSPWHWAILAVVVIVLFGAKKLPDAARSLGKSMRIFKSEMREMQTEGKTEAPSRVATLRQPLSPCSRSGLTRRRLPSRVTPRRARLSPARRRDPERY